MENNTDALSQIGQNRLEQVYMNMPEVRFYFSGDREQSAANLAAYIGNEALELKSLERFSDQEGSIHYYLLLDVSASIPSGEFQSITDGMSAFCSSVRAQDQVTCLTFGEEVQTLFQMEGEELIRGGADGILTEIRNEDQRTLLFEAIHQMAELCDSVPASESTRRIGMVITDGADIATGKATKDEALKILQEKGIPVYGFAAESADRTEKNAFGEFSRSTGGRLTILEKGKEEEGFESVKEEILQSYEAVFTADSNMVSHELTNAVLLFQSEAEKQQMQVMQDRWIADTKNPVIQEVVQESLKQLRIVFSESVTGADAAENFHLISEDQECRIPVFASPGSDGTSTVLSFADELPAGEYQLECTNIRDHSMEQNLLEETMEVSIEEKAENREMAETISESLLKDTAGTSNGVYFGIVSFLAAVVLLAVLFWKKRSKEKQEVLTKADQAESRAILKESAPESHHVVMEKKVLEEKQLFFHVIGQKEEISIVMKKSMIIGRSSACELIFDDPALSRQHFALELKNGEIWIQNLSTSGFTEVNGVKLGTQSRPLSSGDEIHVGQLKMTVRW